MPGEAVLAGIAARARIATIARVTNVLRRSIRNLPEYGAAELVVRLSIVAFARARSSASRGDRVRRTRPPRIADGNARHRLAVDAGVARRSLRRARSAGRRDDRRSV